MNKTESKVAIQEYMIRQNRPYSLQNVLDNMHGRVPRKICQDVLDELTAEKHLTEKEYGKAKIYLANQDKFPEVSKDELGGLDDQINELRKELDSKQSALKERRSKLAEITKEMTNE